MLGGSRPRNTIHCPLRFHSSLLVSSVSPHLHPSSVRVVLCFLLGWKRAAVATVTKQLNPSSDGPAPLPINDNVVPSDAAPSFLRSIARSSFPCKLTSRRVFVPPSFADIPRNVFYGSGITHSGFVPLLTNCKRRSVVEQSGSQFLCQFCVRSLCVSRN